VKFHCATHAPTPASAPVPGSSPPTCPQHTPTHASLYGLFIPLLTLRRMNLCGLRTTYAEKIVVWMGLVRKRALHRPTARHFSNVSAAAVNAVLGPEIFRVGPSRRNSRVGCEGARRSVLRCNHASRFLSFCPTSTVWTIVVTPCDVRIERVAEPSLRIATAPWPSRRLVLSVIRMAHGCAQVAMTRCGAPRSTCAWGHGCR